MKLFALRRRLDVLEAIEHRISASCFDPGRPLSHAQIEELVSYANQAPSAFNLQHWRFMAVTERSEKERLRAVAYHQQMVMDAAVTFIVLGDLNAHSRLPGLLHRCVQAGHFDQASADRFSTLAGILYSDPVARRDEAIRSASMAAMTLMLAAEARGLASGPMVGFEPEALMRAFQIPDHYLPVMLIAVGYRSSGIEPRQPRLALEDVFVHGPWKLP